MQEDLTNKKIKEKLKELPDLPGVYIMRNEDDEIIYVGKAISLKKRVRQYFDNNKNKGAKVLAMVSNIDHFEYIIVENEVEALVLESNLIKKNRPKYNIVLRDDKQYPYIKITREKFPRILKVRNVNDQSSDYFGPFPDAYAVNDAIDLFHQFYPFRTCNLNFDSGKTLDRPCLNYYIKKCNGPCVKKEDEDTYNQAINDVIDFLSKNDPKIPSWVLDQMSKASSNLNFEKAARFRDYYRALSILSQKQNVTETRKEDMDIIATSQGVNVIVIQVFFMRDGKIVDREHFYIKNEFNDDINQVMESFIKQFYLDLIYLPKEILLDTTPNDLELINEFLNKRKKSKVNIHIPKLGRKKELIEMAKKNALDMRLKYEKRVKAKEKIKDDGFEKLKEVLNLKQINRIEAYDISNTSGVMSVGSMVVFEKGAPSYKEFRKFRIKTVDTPNDYASHKEVLTRRLKRGMEEVKKDNTKMGFGHMPDLILMDGGKGQVNIALEVIKDLGLDIEVAGLVKDQFHNTRAIIYKNEEIKVNKNGSVYRFIYKIQEAAHNFAINYHRKLMKNSLTQSELDNIKGVGAVTKENLYKHFKNISNIKKASVEELMQVDRIGKNQALEIYKYFRLKG